MNLGELIRSIEHDIRRAIYGRPSDDADRKLEETNKKVEEIANAVLKIDRRVSEIERAPSPWRELEKTLKGDDGDGSSDGRW